MAEGYSREQFDRIKAAAGERGFTVITGWRPGLENIRLGDIVLSESPAARRETAVTVTGTTSGTGEWCVSRGHPFVTYNPQLDRTYCRCGERQEAGGQPVDWRAKWEIFHDHEPGTPCNCYLPKHS